MMSIETKSNGIAPSVYINLLTAHMMLVRMRDQMIIASCVFEAMVDAEAAITIRPKELARCVSHFADDLQEITETVRWSKEACLK
jgi:hypothetical protein